MIKSLTFSLTLALTFLATTSVTAQEVTSTPPDSMVAIPVTAPQTTDEQSWELCPNPAQALSDVPASAERLQADIDKYTLCLNRAQLLVQLEELRNKGDTPVDAMSLPGAGAPIPLTPEQTDALLGDSETSAAKNDAPETSLFPTVQDISGVNGQLVARVTTPDGDIETVRTGDTLSDGAQVTSITATQVIVRQDGKTTRLEWSQ